MTSILKFLALTEFFIQFASATCLALYLLICIKRLATDLLKEKAPSFVAGQSAPNCVHLQLMISAVCQREIGHAELRFFFFFGIQVAQCVSRVLPHSFIPGLYQVLHWVIPQYLARLDSESKNGDQQLVKLTFIDGGL